MRKLFVLTALLFAVCFSFAGPARAANCPGADGWSFNDVSSTDPFCTYITFMAQSGITGGCKVIDATHRLYCPADAVTRTQMAKFMKSLADIAGVTLFAAVNADGTLARGPHAVSSSVFHTGQFEVIFDRDITSCGYTVTLGEAGAGSGTPGQAGVTRRSTNLNGVFVQTADSDGTPASRAFYVIVTC